MIFGQDPRCVQLQTGLPLSSVVHFCNGWLHVMLTQGSIFTTPAKLILMIRVLIINIFTLANNNKREKGVLAKLAKDLRWEGSDSVIQY